MMAQEAEIGRKASLLSILSVKYEDDRRKSSLGQKVPKDPYYVVYITCFLMGFMNVVPIFFFNAAAGYWMYKFRDPSLGSGTTSGSERTTLQAYYQPCAVVAQQLPSIIFSFILTVYGHKFSAMKRVLVTLSLFVVLYLTFAVFTQINTDSWQSGFFVMTISLLVLNTALTATIQMSSAVVMAKLPQNYLMSFLLGQNGSILTSILQIIAVAVTDFQPTAGLIYFLVGSFIIAITLALLMMSRNTKLFEHYQVEVANNQHSEMISRVEAKELLKKIWPSLVITCILIGNMTTIHPAITTLVESQYNNTSWSDKYFTPVCVFLTSDAASLLGRIVSNKALITESNKWWYVVITLARFLVSVPICMLFDAQPRTNIPVIFNKDWEFIIFSALFGFTMGFLMNISFMSLKSLAPGKQEQSLKIMVLSFSLTSAITAANGLLMVKALLL
ncbi:unnamed protein product [Psylliodes chrysocephalus]|uniref:Equilibrative nucleoside transporter n=1 Tax=Psylliodes chrysocephalus TaxID=3402493 RepID=A0A9P0D737_9CUCU|nr:unnamed protein product [Psylliodes chrysocephala]